MEKGQNIMIFGKKCKDYFHIDLAMYVTVYTFLIVYAVISYIFIYL